MNQRECLEATREGRTRKFSIPYVRDDGTKDKLKFYVTANTYPDGRLGEIFIRGDKQGGLVSGALDAMATMISIALQHGVPLEMITSKLRKNRFGPSGFTGDPEFPSCSSPFDLIAQYLDARFGKKISIELESGEG